MQAMILAAGTGSRLGKYTVENTKCMLEVNGKTLIKRALDALNDAGITKLVLVVGYKKDNLIEHVGFKHKNIDIQYVYNEIYDRTNNIYSLFLAKDELMSDDTILLESDLIFDTSILTNLINDPRPSLAVVDKYESWMDGTSVTLDDNDNILNFYGKKSFDFDNISNYYKTVNIYKFSKEFSTNMYIPFLSAYVQAKGDNEYYESVLNVLTVLGEHELRAKRLSLQKWYEIDDIQDKENAEIIFAETRETKLKLLQSRYGGYWKFPKMKDFCYLVNPYFPSSKYIKEMKAYFTDLISQYPSGQTVQNMLGGKMFGIESENVLVGNGAAEIIKHLNVLEGKFGIAVPTFNEYTNAIGHDRFIKINGINGYTRNDLMNLLNSVNNLILVNPDNPSGYLSDKNDVLDLLKEAKKQNKNIIVDESFMDFATNAEKQTLVSQEIIDEFPNLIIIKSISKSYGVPGIRLGVVITSNTAFLSSLRSTLSIWNINSFGEYFLQTIGKYKNDYKEACVNIRKERDRFYDELTKNDIIEVFKSEANYFLCKVNGDSTKLCEILVDFNVYCKDLKYNEGINGDYVRIAVRNREDNDSLLLVLKIIKDTRMLEA